MRCKKEDAPERLMLFPSPYPGESFYSILCRYHVRSGNSCDQHTIHQLFGRNRSLRSTLLSPLYIQYANNWFAPDSDLNAEILLRQHTAYDLFALNADEYERSRMLGMLSGKIEPTYYPAQVQSRLKHPSGFLRYCPACTEAQKKLYGEAYWQILPQLDGVEYCPIHKCRILNSPFRLSNIQHRFYPASEVLNEHCAPVENAESAWDNLFTEEQQFFIRLAEGMYWLLSNGNKYEGRHRLYKSYYKVFGSPRSQRWPSIPLRSVHKFLDAVSHSYKLHRFFEQKSNYSPCFEEVFLFSTSLCTHVMLMVLLAGDPESFYSE